MPPARSPISNAMLAHLADGRWYRRDEIIRIGMRAVPPGRAIQQRETERRRNLTTGTGPTRAATVEAQIATGARSVARRQLDSLVARGHVERNDQLVRRTP